MGSNIAEAFAIFDEKVKASREIGGESWRCDPG